MKLDPTKMQDWEIAKAAEKKMKSLSQLAKILGVKKSEYLCMGRNIGKIYFSKVNKRIISGAKAKYIAVTAITPTPFGEGKTTTTLGLVDGLARMGKKVTGAIRQPSCGPTFNIKGSGAGGGLSQCIPLTELSIRATGDMDSITNAHNLSMVALTSRMQHESNYDDEKLSKIGLKRLNIDPKNVMQKWVIDFCAQALRKITIGRGEKFDGVEMDSGFQITASSEVMAILSIADNLEDLRTRLSEILMAYSKEGKEIKTKDLEVDGAMAAWLVDSINPNLFQTIEGNPVFVHAGPFANIAIGQSSIIADKLALNLSEYHVTESGFGSDIGYEKFWNIKCRLSGLKPDGVVIVATIRALKMHGGGPSVKPGQSLSEVYLKENLELVRKGCENLIAHINIVKKSNIKPIVCLNHFSSDFPDEIEIVKKISLENGAYFALSDHWLKGGAGAEDLAKMVIKASEEENNFKFLYEDGLPIVNKIEIIAKEIYGADKVEYSPVAKAKLEKYQSDSLVQKFSICMAKTHLSLSSDPNLKGRPRGWILPIEDILLFKGARFLIPVTGSINLMPGTGSNPSFRRIDIDVKRNEVLGIF
jgi:formate--tetrahydrofolate ligase